MNFDQPRRNSRVRRIYLFFGICIVFFSIAQAIEVGGHLTEDTTWSPNNNPYEVVDNVFVDAGVTLTILPGTEVVIQSAQLTCLEDFNDNFWYQNGNNAAKMIWVNGNIIAEGTAEDSILFTHDQNDFNYYWGCIYITENSEMPIFTHCIVEYSGGTGIAVGNIANAAISIRNGLGIIKHCSIINNSQAIYAVHIPTYNMEVVNCAFYNDNVNYYVLHIWGGYHLSIRQPAENYPPALIAHNYFNGRHIDVTSAYYVNNIFLACNEVNSGGQFEQISYFYDNDFTGCPTGIYGGNPGDSIFIKNNRFINGYDGLDLDEAYVEISDNYFEGCDMMADYQTSGKIFNNKLNNGAAYGSGQVDYFNNISYNNTDGIGLCATFQRLSCTNNISVNNRYAFEASNSFDNSIFIGNENLEQFGVTGNPIFRNCIIDFPLEYPLIDGGGNIIVDSLQAQSIFEDIQNGNFHLAPSSIAIDAGFDTLGYYYPFDMDYNHRIWDGDNNGSAIIDIGPYEYGAPAFGGINGITYDPTSGLPVDYVLIKIDNIAGEFTFSDSVGSYEYKLPAGVYDVYAERVFYDDAVEYQIEVFDGEFTQLDIPMSETTKITQNLVPKTQNRLTNYPNPFNPSTTISFSNEQNQQNEQIEIVIYNIKGQKVKTLPVPESQSHTFSVIWNGDDESGKPVSSGIYFYQLRIADKPAASSKMLLVK